METPTRRQETIRGLGTKRIEMSNNALEAMDTSPAPSPSPKSISSQSVSRMWGAAAQRNLRNQWSKLAALKGKWDSVSNSGKSHAVSIINTFLSYTYIPSMEFGALTNMPLIREKARRKLSKQLEDHRRRLLCSYKGLIEIAVEMIETRSSMRCYMKNGNNPSFITFGNSKEQNDDDGDGGGVPVFSFLSVTEHEEMAKELSEMFSNELIVKRLITADLITMGCKLSEPKWPNELYINEFNDLTKCNLISEVQMRDASKFVDKKDRETLQVYLTAWLAEVNINCYRLDDIFSVIEEEIRVNLLFK